MLTEMADVPPSAVLVSDDGLTAMADSVGVCVVLSFFAHEVNIPIEMTPRMIKIRLIELQLKNGNGATR